MEDCSDGHSGRKLLILVAIVLKMGVIIGTVNDCMHLNTDYREFLNESISCRRAESTVKQMSVSTLKSD